MLASLLSVPQQLGYPGLALLVGAESTGVPVPGETALIAAAVLAAHGKLNLAAVIAVAAAGAIVGDNIGYTIGRKGGRALLEKPGPLLTHRRRVLEKGEPFYARHGSKAVFLGRWVALLRIAAAWLAGINHMPWTRFVAWNALGGIAWAASVGVVAYLLGPTAETLIKDVGLAGAAVAVAAGALLIVWRRRATTR